MNADKYKIYGLKSDAVQWCHLVSHMQTFSLHKSPKMFKIAWLGSFWCA